MFLGGSLDRKEIRSPFLSSETGVLVQRLMYLADSDNGLVDQNRWRGLSKLDDTVESQKNIYEEVLRLLLNLVCRKTIHLN